MINMNLMKRPMSENYLTDDERWQAVVRRDGKADGKFYYSVKTTGVYCRPSCTSRRPLRENVAFHASAQEAERASFRPCKRCQPDRISVAEEQAGKIAHVCRQIEQAETAPALEALAKQAGMSPFHFHRLFKKTTGLTPKDYFKAHRARQVRNILPQRRTVTHAIYEAGFNSSGRFYADASAMLGMRPKSFRHQGTGEVIRFAVGECSLGSILVAATDKGVCAISMGDNAEELVHEFQTDFRCARIIGGDREFEKLVARVVGFVEQPQTGLDLPLDIRGTAFQQRVWDAMRKIPMGSTTSYTELARRVGSPNAVRAVASACASNKIALAIPCHRVVRASGELSGYRWGVKRKQALLKREHEAK